MTFECGTNAELTVGLSTPYVDDEPECEILKGSFIFSLRYPLAACLFRRIFGRALGWAKLYPVLLFGRP